MLVQPTPNFLLRGPSRKRIPEPLMERSTYSNVLLHHVSYLKHKRHAWLLPFSRPYLSRCDRAPQGK
ncbi:hypothetical protein CY34DRAFT_165470 [Suillus luteus UH-Slu-Lm8-n1]|uniref:Uncharacterized protein n=1 Tax=Suillus luteus UH-Slu-Lm8-n1 TaxID=930992 RepID=A0A0D0AW10_9AGAM|nr:hypothetical protein CY34DRAFT_165470 [Suillus luteus UH-Slu-Lm8-n1]